MISRANIYHSLPPPPAACSATVAGRNANRQGSDRARQIASGRANSAWQFFTPSRRQVCSPPNVAFVRQADTANCQARPRARYESPGTVVRSEQLRSRCSVSPRAGLPTGSPPQKLVNILFCTLSYYPGITGGAERQARLQAEELVRRGHRVTVVCARTDNLDSEEIAGVRIIRLRRNHRRHLFRISYLLHLLAWLMRNVGDLRPRARTSRQHASRHRRGCRPRHTATCLCQGRLRGAVGEAQRFRSMAKLTRWYGLRHADRVQVLSDEIEAELTAIGVTRAAWSRFRTGSTWSNSAPFRPSLGDAYGRSSRFPSDCRIVLFVGRLVEYKGIYDLLQAWLRLRDENAQLVIVGATDEDLNPPSGVIVRGWVDSPLSYLQAADVFVHPSHADGMSNALLEAMACGCAPIATEHGATNGFLRAGEDALLVPVRDAEHSPKHSGASSGCGPSRAVGGQRSQVGTPIRPSGVVDQIEAEYRTSWGPPSQASDRRLDGQVPPRCPRPSERGSQVERSAHTGSLARATGRDRGQLAQRLAHASSAERMELYGAVYDRVYAMHFSRDPQTLDFGAGPELVGFLEKLTLPDDAFWKSDAAVACWRSKWLDADGGCLASRCPRESSRRPAVEQGPRPI